MNFSISALTAIMARVLWDGPQPQIQSNRVVVNSVPFEAREHWMQRAVDELVAASGPCPMYAYGAIIVNHTANPWGSLVCVGANSVGSKGDPTQHGEINAIQTCADQFYRSNMTVAEVSAAFEDLSLYTTAESCPMCASAIRWANFKEYIYGTSIHQLIDYGIEQIDVASRYIYQQSYLMSRANPRIIGPISTEKTNPYFRWIYTNQPCPNGCHHSNSTCVAN